VYFLEKVSVELESHNGRWSVGAPLPLMEDASAWILTSLTVERQLTGYFKGLYFTSAAPKVTEAVPSCEMAPLPLFINLGVEAPLN